VDKGTFRSQPLVVLFAAALVATLAGWVYSRNSLFMLSEITIKTESPELENDLRKNFVGYLGKRLTALSLSQLESIAMKDPRIKKAVFHKRWPNSLLIVIEERKAVAMTFIQGKLWTLDENGEPIAILRRAEALPLLKRYKRQADQLVQISNWLSTVKETDQFDEVEWVDDRGLVIKNYSQDFDIELGFADFDSAWRRADSSLTFVRTKNISAVVLDASYSHRVVIRPKSELQNFENKLNLRKLVRRAESFSPAAR